MDISTPGTFPFLSFSCIRRPKQLTVLANLANLANSDSRYLVADYRILRASVYTELTKS